MKKAIIFWIKSYRRQCRRHTLIYLSVRYLLFWLWVLHGGNQISPLVLVQDQPRTPLGSPSCSVQTGLVSCDHTHEQTKRKAN